MGLFAVADGVGGETGGEIASHLAVEALRRFFAPCEDEPLGCAQMEWAFGLAHRDIVNAAIGSLERMGTTLATLRFSGGYGIVAHVGDSRIYRMRDGELTRLTVDHTIAEQKMVCGGGLSGYDSGDVLVRALAPRVDARADVTAVDVRAGDTYLVCSDGVSKPLGDRRIAEALMMRVELAADAIVQRALGIGGHDNATAIVVRVEET